MRFSTSWPASRAQVAVALNLSAHDAEFGADDDAAAIDERLQVRVQLRLDTVPAVSQAHLVAWRLCQHTTRCDRRLHAGCQREKRQWDACGQKASARQSTL